MKTEDLPMQDRWRANRVVFFLCLCVGVGGCKKEQPAATGVPKVPEVGGCENIDFKGATCELDLLVVTSLDPGQPGAKVVRVSHTAKVGDRVFQFDSFQLAVPEARIKELGGFFKEHSPVGCDGVIVRPPCNPDATAVQLKLTLPDYVKPHR